MKHTRRAGLSLLEVLVATAILMASAVLLFELAEVGRGHAAAAEDKATAQRIAQTLLNEMIVGARPLQSATDEPVAGEPDWVASVEIRPLELALTRSQVAVVRVHVARVSVPTRRGEQFTLWRWVHVPAESP